MSSTQQQMAARLRDLAATLDAVSVRLWIAKELAKANEYRRDLAAFKSISGAPRHIRKYRKPS